MHKRLGVALVLSGSLSFVALGFAAPSGPSVPPLKTAQPSPPSPIPTLSMKLPPGATPSKNAKISPASIRPLQTGEDPSLSFFARTSRHRGRCVVGEECILLGRRFAHHAPNATTAADRKLFVDWSGVGGYTEVTPTAWTQYVIAFPVKPDQARGKATILLKDGANTVRSNAFVVDIVSKPTKEDADGDGHKSIEAGGDDCDDLDPDNFPGNAQASNADQRDNDCEPTTFPKRDVDGDGESSGELCTVNVEGRGIDRYLEWTCGADCDDTKAALVRESMRCDSRDPKLIFVCRGGKSRVDPFGPGGMWEAYDCTTFNATTCVAQPNGTGFCR